MTPIKFTEEIKLGEKAIDDIKVSPLSFHEFADLVEGIAGSKDVVKDLRMARLIHQVHFKSGEERVTPTQIDIRALPATVARQIIDALDIGQGEPGKVVDPKADGANTPIIYKLGKPILMSSSKGDLVIEELEFSAKTYGDLEDVYAAEGEVARTMALLRTVARPVGVSTLKLLPGWAVDQITSADGFTMMRTVQSRF